MITELYRAHLAAEAAADAARASTAPIDMLPLGQACDRAWAAYMAAVKAARLEWEALPKGDRKDCAEQNAYDTEDTDEDELRWFEVALATYDAY
jgi:hypothetical protein